MSNTSSEIVVGSAGQVYIAPVGSTLPSSTTTAVDAAFFDLGYISEDGVTWTNSVDVQDINAFQSLLPVRRVVTGRTTELSFTLRQWNAATFSFALGGGSFDTVGSDYIFTPPANGAALQEFSVVFDWADGDKKYRLIIARAAVTDSVETQIVRNAASDLPIKLSVFGSDDTDAYELYTNDPAFAGA